MAYRPQRRKDRRKPPGLTFDSFCPLRQDVIGPSPHQRGLCRCGCGEKLEGRQSTWRKGHADRVVADYQLAAGYSGEIRRRARSRDRGVCALCKLDTYSAKRQAIENPQARAKYIRLGFPSPSDERTTWWDADHILPVAEGGPHTMDNIRTLCIRCHKTVTAELTKRLANRPKNGVLQLALPTE